MIIFVSLYYNKVHVLLVNKIVKKSVFLNLAFDKCIFLNSLYENLLNTLKQIQHCDYEINNAK